MAIGRLAIVFTSLLMGGLLFTHWLTATALPTRKLTPPHKKGVMPPPNEKALAQLGHWLFFDNRLSLNQTKSCAACHAPEKAFTDAYRTSVGSTGSSLSKNAPSLLNAVYRHPLGWQDSSLQQLQDQLHRPFFNQDPPELGWTQQSNVLAQRLSSDAFYREQFTRLFGTEQPYQWKNIFQALVAYEKQLVSFQSRYDAYLHNKARLGPAAAQGKDLFFSEKLSCGKCHVWVSKQATALPFRPASFLEPAQPNKLYRVPDLRNVVLTAPYGHAGDWSDLPAVFRAKGYRLTPKEEQALLAFLDSFTDTGYLKNPFFLNPYSAD